MSHLGCGVLCFKCGESYVHELDSELLQFLNCGG